jgi:hypothetical protein
MQPSNRTLARQNLLVATVNKALEMRLFTLDAGKKIEPSFFDLTIGGYPVKAYVNDAGFDEVLVEAVVCPTTDKPNYVWRFVDREWRKRGSAMGRGWLERRTGKYLQTGYCWHGTKAMTKSLAALTVRSAGFDLKPTKNGYDFVKECEGVFGKPPKRSDYRIVPPPRTGEIYATLRAEFEPLLLAPSGFCRDAGRCAEAWARWSEEQLQDQIDRSIAWLRLCGTTEKVERKQSSYGIKHEAERWWREKGANYGGYICNGALIMAALRLGMLVERIGSSPNACLNLAKHRPCVWDLSEPCPRECQCHSHEYCKRKLPGAEPRLMTGLAAV